MWVHVCGCMGWACVVATACVHVCACVSVCFVCLLVCCALVCLCVRVSPSENGARQGSHPPASPVLPAAACSNSDCAVCSSSDVSQCLECNEPLYLHNQECVVQCPDGLVADPFSAVPASSVSSPPRKCGGKHLRDGNLLHLFSSHAVGFFFGPVSIHSNQCCTKKHVFSRQLAICHN